MFPELGELPAELAQRRVLLDGEVVALRPDGSQDFHALTSRRPRDTRIAFMCFDVLHLDGRDLIADSYAARRQELEQLHLKQDRWLTTPSLQGIAGVALCSFTLDRGWEGVVAKRLDFAIPARGALTAPGSKRSTRTRATSKSTAPLGRRASAQRSTRR
jgi:bifunctional non-homologous end joining protein LigD